jgi:peptide/nickel transport system substrate-binding protein
MDGGNYWSGAFQRRISRRRSLAATGGVALGASILSACGGNESAKQDASSLVSPPIDTSKQATRGGILKDRAYSDAPSLSLTGRGGLFLRTSVGKVYNTMLRFQFGVLEAPSDELEGSLVESWEWAPDGLQIVMKVRQGVKFHAKPPVNGRNLDIDDVVLTYDRFTRGNPYREEVSNVLNPQAPVLSFTASDARTIVIKLKEPIPAVLYYFANAGVFGLNVLPKEVDTNWDDRADMIGTGPFMLTNYTPSVGYTFKRNPDFWDKDEALVEQIEQPIVSEYSAALAQFKAGAIFSMGPKVGPQVKQEEILSVKADQPQILIYQDDMKRFSEAWPMIFGWLPEGQTPFLDERVRQALSMSWDRDLYLDTFHNVATFESEGLPVEKRWNSHVGASGRSEPYWLDPKGKDFGPNAKYFQHDPAEARKLLAAAGYPNGIQNVLANQVAGPELPSAKHAEVINGFASEIGITSKVNLLDYVKEYQEKYRFGKGQFEGWLFGSDASGAAGDVASALANSYWSKGQSIGFKGFSKTGRNDQSGDPQVDAQIEKARLERDNDKLRAIVFELQRYLAKTMYVIQPPGVAAGFTMAWPCVGNFRAFNHSSSDFDHYRIWVDQTKPPFKSA